MKRIQRAADRCTGAGGAGCQCRYHSYRRVYKSATRKADRVIARLHTGQSEPVTSAGRRYLTTPRIQAIIEACRPEYLRAIATPKPKGRPRKAA